ncbi:probable G-protein coupled receptor Mth-like 14 isoform X2 [Culicoides brevitarsis]
MKFLTIFTIVSLFTAKTLSNPDNSSNELPLYDNYDDEYYDETQKPPEILPSTTSSTTEFATTQDEEIRIHVAGALGAFKNNPKRDQMMQKLLHERVDGDEVPSDCSQYKMLKSQPAVLPVVTVPKCCKMGENYYMNDTSRGCDEGDVPLDFELIHAVFYDGCIEDQELNMSYKIELRAPCAGGMLYSEVYNDFLYVLSNGSLLRVSNDWQSYDIFDDYCLDMANDNNSWILSAISCHDVYGGVIRVSEIQGVICAVLMMISVPCLVMVALIYFFIPNLNDLHGKALALHSICLAMGFLMLALIEFTSFREGITGYFVQYFMLAAFFWMLLMVMDNAVEVWHYLPHGMEMTPAKECCRLFSYFLLAHGLPVIFVLLTWYEGYPGLPSYYFRANDAGEMASQKFFIPVVTVIVCASFVIAIITEWGYAKLTDLNDLSIMNTIAKKLSRQSSRTSRTTLQRQISEKVRNLDPARIEKVSTM